MPGCEALEAAIMPLTPGIVAAIAESTDDISDVAAALEASKEAAPRPTPVPIS